MTLKWPRGKYNGWRIVGVSTRVSVDVTKWWWCVKWAHGNVMIHLGPFHSWTTAEYEQKFAGKAQD